MKLTCIEPQSQRVSPWSHGATREIARGGDPWQWRASVARIDAAGDFTAFPGKTRLIALLDGGPLTLDVDERRIDIAPRLSAQTIPSDTPCNAQGDFPCSVFNLIYDPHLIDAKLLPRPLVGAMVLFNEIDVSWLVYLVSGEATLRAGERSQWLGAQHALLLSGDGSGGRAVLDGGGEVVLCRIAPLARLT